MNLNYLLSIPKRCKTKRSIKTKVNKSFSQVVMEAEFRAQQVSIIPQKKEEK